MAPSLMTSHVPTQLHKTQILTLPTLSYSLVYDDNKQ